MYASNRKRNREFKRKKIDTAVRAVMNKHLADLDAQVTGNDLIEILDKLLNEYIDD